MKKKAKLTKKLPPDPIKTRLILALDSSEVTRTSIAKHFNISLQAVSEWFNPNKPGKCEPDRYPDLADLLSVNLRWLLSGKGPQEGIAMTERMFDLVRRYQMLQDSERDAVNDLIDGMLRRRQAEPDRSFGTGARR